MLHKFSGNASTLLTAMLFTASACDSDVRECQAPECACTDDKDYVMSTCFYREGADCIIQYECDNGYPLPATERDRIHGDPSVQCAPVSCDGRATTCRDVTTWSPACQLGVCVAVTPVVEAF